MCRAACLIVAFAALLLAPAAHAADTIDSTPLSGLLHTYVDQNGRVDYAKWHANKRDQARLDTYLTKVGKAELDKTSKSARLAFYINAYNATVIDSVLDHWPIKSVQNVDGFFKTSTHNVAGEHITLDTLENKRIRAKFDEPRVHFVLVCGAKSCPRLRRDALSADHLDKTLDAAAREFIRQQTHTSDKGVTTSRIFRWFRADFKKAAGSLNAFLAKYVDATTKKRLQADKTSISFAKYDWAINDQP